MSEESEAPVEERRAEDQDAAIEQAFASGVLPEEDRREPEIVEEPPVVPEPETQVEEPAPPVTPAVEEEPPFVALQRLLDGAGVGSVFEKTRTGWKVRYVDGGTVLPLEGATIPEALASYGQQVIHPAVKKA